MATSMINTMPPVTLSAPSSVALIGIMQLQNAPTGAQVGKRHNAQMAGHVMHSHPALVWEEILHPRQNLRGSRPKGQLQSQPEGQHLCQQQHDSLGLSKIVS
mmetsp:Transcript_28134/g.50901  ORF Transcript_28134/g.50901 Transcript_28134/m.50901 type:complete len:102 (+) Transcript_28134:805-1110(+)